jgi:hypothetical protein
LGGQAGFRPAGGLRLGTGYNLFGMVDTDRARPSVTRHGVYVDSTITATERLFGLLDE